MAILPDAPNCLSTTLIGLNQGQPWMNKIHFHATTGAFVQTPTGIADLFTFNDAVAAAWGSSIAPLCSTGVTLVNVNSIDLTTRTSITAYTQLATPTPGTRGAPTLPVQVACAMSWHVSNRYRGGHGRIYLPAGQLADMTTGRLWSSAYLTSARAAATSFFTALNGLSVGAIAVDLVVLSYYFGSHKTPTDPHPIPVLRTTPLAMNVTSATVHTRVDTQRRRLGKEAL